MSFNSRFVPTDIPYTCTLDKFEHPRVRPVPAVGRGRQKAIALAGSCGCGGQPEGRPAAAAASQIADL